MSREKLELGNQSDDAKENGYYARCHGCYTDKGIGLHALRYKDREGLCGFLFVCQECLNRRPDIWYVLPGEEVVRGGEVVAE